MRRSVLAGVVLVAVGVGLGTLVANDDGKQSNERTQPPTPARWAVALVVEFDGQDKLEADRVRLRAGVTSIPIRINPRDCWLLDREPAVRLDTVETRSSVIVTASVERSQGEGALCLSYVNRTIKLNRTLGDRELLVGGFGTPYPAKRARL